MLIKQRCHSCGHEWKGKVKNSRVCIECGAGELFVSLKPPRSNNKEKFSTLKKLSEYKLSNDKEYRTFEIKDESEYLNLDHYANKMMHARWFNKFNGRGSSPETFIDFDGMLWGLEFKANTGITPVATRSLRKKQKNTKNLINYLAAHVLEHHYDDSNIKLLVVIQNEHNPPMLGSKYKVIGVSEFNKMLESKRIKPVSIKDLRFYRKKLRITKGKTVRHTSVVKKSA